MSSPTTVLVVDDEEFVRESLAELIRAHGHSVATARNGGEAVRWLESNHCDVILSDLRMPRSDGMSLLAQAQRRNAQIPIILITGAGTVQDAVQAMRQGAFDFVLSPVKCHAITSPSDCMRFLTPTSAAPSAICIRYSRPPAPMHHACLSLMTSTSESF
jgi:DNA-binding NtrC family response regulator